MIYIFVGVQGSGKSTFAKKLSVDENAIIVSTDAVRKEFPGIEEYKVWINVYDKLAECLKNNINAIFDATSITVKVRKRFFDEMEKREAKVQASAIYFDTPIKECVKRVEKRNLDKNELFLPLEVIPSYAEKLEIPTVNEGFEKVYIVKNGKMKEMKNK